MANNQNKSLRAKAAAEAEAAAKLAAGTEEVTGEAIPVVDAESTGVTGEEVTGTEDTTETGTGASEAGTDETGATGEDQADATDTGEDTTDAADVAETGTAPAVVEEGVQDQSGEDTTGETTEVDANTEATDPIVSDAPAVEAAVIADPVDPAPAEEAPKAALDPLTLNGAILVRDRLEQYIDAMKAGKPQTKTSGANGQLILYRLFAFVMRQRGEEFTAALDELLATIKANSDDNGVFGERYAFRYLNDLSISSKERVNFQALLSAFITLADKGTRNAKLKSVDIPKAFAGVTDATANSLLVEYFTPRI